MQVSIKALKVDMDIKSKGIELDVYDGAEHLGDLYVTMTGLTWCSGKTTRAKGKKIGWNQFIAFADPAAAAKRATAKKAAKKGGLKAAA